MFRRRVDADRVLALRAAAKRIDDDDGDDDDEDEEGDEEMGPSGGGDDVNRVLKKRDVSNPRFRLEHVTGLLERNKVILTDEDRQKYLDIHQFSYAKCGHVVNQIGTEQRPVCFTCMRIEQSGICTWRGFWRYVHWFFTLNNMVVETYHLFITVFPEKLGVMLGVFVLSTQAKGESTLADPNNPNSDVSDGGLTITAAISLAQLGHRLKLILEGFGSFFVLVMILQIIVRIETFSYQFVDGLRRHRRARFLFLEKEARLVVQNFPSRQYDYWSEDEDPDVSFINLHGSGATKDAISSLRKCLNRMPCKSASDRAAEKIKNGASSCRVKCCCFRSKRIKGRKEKKQGGHESDTDSTSMEGSPIQSLV